MITFVRVSCRLVCLLGAHVAAKLIARLTPTLTPTIWPRAEMAPMGPRSGRGTSRDVKAWAAWAVRVTFVNHRSQL